MSITKAAFIQQITRVLAHYPTQDFLDNEQVQFQCEALKRLLPLLERNLPESTMSKIVANFFKTGIDGYPHGKEKAFLLCDVNTPYYTLAIALNGGAEYPLVWPNPEGPASRFPSNQAGLKYLASEANNLDCDWEKEDARHGLGQPQALPAASSASAASAEMAILPVVSASAIVPSAEYVAPMKALSTNHKNQLIAKISDGTLTPRDFTPLLGSAGQGIVPQLNETLVAFGKSVARQLANQAADLFMQTKESVANRFLPEIPYAMDPIQLAQWSVRDQKRVSRNEEGAIESDQGSSIFSPAGLLEKLRDLFATHVAQIKQDRKNLKNQRGFQDLEALWKEFQEICCDGADLEDYQYLTKLTHLIAYGDYDGKKGNIIFPESTDRSTKEDVYIPITSGFAHPADFINSRRANIQHRLQALAEREDAVSASSRRCLNGMLDALDMYQRFGQPLHSKSFTANTTVRIEHGEDTALSLLPVRLRTLPNHVAVMLSKGELLWLFRKGIFEWVVQNTVKKENLLTQLEAIFRNNSLDLQAVKALLGEERFNVFLVDLQAEVKKAFESRMMDHSQENLMEVGEQTELRVVRFVTPYTPVEYGIFLSEQQTRNTTIRQQIKTADQGLAQSITTATQVLKAALKSYDEAKTQTELVSRKARFDKGTLSILDFSTQEELKQNIGAGLIESSSKLLEGDKAAYLTELKMLAELCPGLFPTETTTQLSLEAGPALSAIAAPSNTTELNFVGIQGMVKNAQRDLLTATQVSLVQWNKFREIMQGVANVTTGYSVQTRMERQAGWGIADRLYRKNYAQRNAQAQDYNNAMNDILSQKTDLKLRVAAAYRQLNTLFMNADKGVVTMSTLHGNIKAQVLDPLLAFAQQLGVSIDPKAVTTDLVQRNYNTATVMQQGGGGYQTQRPQQQAAQAGSTWSRLATTVRALKYGTSATQDEQKSLLSRDSTA